MSTTYGFDRNSAIREKAERFAEHMVRKYKNEEDTDIQYLMSKTYKYKEKLGFSDDEFNMFINIILDTARPDIPDIRAPVPEDIEKYAEKELEDANIAAENRKNEIRVNAENVASYIIPYPDTNMRSIKEIGYNLNLSMEEYISFFEIIIIFLINSLIQNVNRLRLEQTGGLKTSTNIPNVEFEGLEDFEETIMREYIKKSAERFVASVIDRLINNRISNISETEIRESGSDYDGYYYLIFLETIILMLMDSIRSRKVMRGGSYRDNNDMMLYAF